MVESYLRCRFVRWSSLEEDFSTAPPTTTVSSFPRTLSSIYEHTVGCLRCLTAENPRDRNLRLHEAFGKGSIMTWLWHPKRTYLFCREKMNQNNQTYIIYIWDFLRTMSSFVCVSKNPSPTSCKSYTESRSLGLGCHVWERKIFGALPCVVGMPRGISARWS